MPALSLAVNVITRTIQTRETIDLNTSPPFPPFHQPEYDDDDDSGRFQTGKDTQDESDGLSPGIIAAIAISVLVFFAVIIGLFVYFNRRRRQARMEEFAMKEDITSATAVPTSRALDPPPPYDEGHVTSRPPEPERRWDSRSNISGNEGQDEDSDEIGSHATITDGLAPERHSGSRAG